jgi:hypothetical protein
MIMKIDLIITPQVPTLLSAYASFGRSTKEITLERSLSEPSLKKESSCDIQKENRKNTVNAYTTVYVRKHQKMTAKETNSDISLLFSYDVLHGRKTILHNSPGESASWDLVYIGRTASVSASKSGTSVINPAHTHLPLHYFKHNYHFSFPSWV